MKIPLAKYGAKEILMFLAALLMLAAVLIYYHYDYLLPLPAVILGFVFYFFRDPERAIPAGENLVVSPADGRIIEISEVVENSFLKEEAVKIAIFLSVFNVHVNRSPVKGQVQWLAYHPGKFLVASEKAASTDNESNTIGLETSIGRVVVRQVAGIIARRIVCACWVGEEVQLGQRIGMIKFGSRTELYLPKKSVAGIEVKLNDKVKGGVTVLAKLKVPTPAVAPEPVGQRL